MYLLADPDLSLSSLLKLIPSLGVTGVVIVFSWLMVTGRIVRRGELDAAEKRTEEWKEVALRSLGNNERLVGGNERAVRLSDEVVKTNTRSDT